MTKVNHEYKAEDCSICNGKPKKTELVNYDYMWRDGDVICGEKGCNRFVRYYDAG